MNDLTALINRKSKELSAGNEEASHRKQPHKGGNENKDYIKSLYRKYLGK